MPPPAVRVALVEERTVAAPRTVVGAVAPSREALVGSELAGLVVEWLAEAGARVEQGAPLAHLRTVDVESRLEVARAGETLRKAELRELENGTRPEELARAKARVEELVVQVELRRWRLEAAQRLYDTRTISEDELVDARLALRAAERLQEALQADLDLAEAGTRDERIEAARARLAAQAAEVKRLEDEEARHVIRAPFAGWVVEERAEVGQWLRQGDPVARIAALDEVDVVFAVVEDDVGGCRLGLEVLVSVPALPDLPVEAATGRIVAVVPAGDPRSRTFPVKVRLANRRDGSTVLLKAGMFARATIPLGEATRVLLVPKDALVLGGPRPRLFVVGDEGRVDLVEVDLGFALEGMVQVVGPVQAGQRVVVRGNEPLQPGQTVRVLD
jgi:multidrug efflux pump subunit AcrA (membrane-fusion protein)